MNQSERRNYLIQKLLEEQPQYAKMQIPGRCEEQKTLLRALMNVRMPGELSEEFLQIQDAYLAEENAGRGALLGCILLEDDSISQRFQFHSLYTSKFLLTKFIAVSTQTP